MKLEFDEIESPIGTLLLVCGDTGVLGLEFDADADRARARLLARFGSTELCRRADPRGFGRALAAYFAGDLRAIERIPVDPGGTPFQRRVWEELRRIPVGETRSYRDVARAIGRPSATRAVGAANGANPVAVIVPCHRVVGADGTLTGYGGGLERKRWLLAHEGASTPTRASSTRARRASAPPALDFRDRAGGSRA
jgi:methylated-DNA-[protein]-cysteine S-methyltransferase